MTQTTPASTPPTLIKPPALKPGDCIGVMAPSSYVEREDIERSVKRLEALGYKVFVHPQTYERDGQSAGTPLQKTLALQGLWQRADIHAVWAAGGGNRCLQILDSINFKTMARHAKWLVGFSDVTCLLNALYAHTGIAGLHAPVFKQLHVHADLQNALDMMAGKVSAMDLKGARVLRPGQAQGPLIGGNLSLFHLLPHTLPGSFWAGGILFLEDTGDELSHIDRMFIQLRRLGVLEDIAGLVLGQFSKLKDTGRPFGRDLEAIAAEHTQDFKGPVIIDAPIGHGERLFPLPIGVSARLDTDPLALNLAESAVSQSPVA